MSLKLKTLKGFFWTFFDQFGRTGIRFVVQLFLARLIAPEQFGLLGMIGIFYAVAEALSNAGLNQSLIRTKDPQDIDYTTVFWQNLLISLGVYILIFISAPFIADFYQQEVLSSLIRVFSLSIIINGFSSIQTTKLVKEMNFKAQTTINIPSIIVSSVLGIILAMYGYGVWALVYMQLAQSSIMAIQLWIKSSWKPNFHFDKKTAAYHFNFGYKLMLSGLTNNVFLNIYPMIIGKFNEATQVGYYTRALSFRSLPTIMIARMYGQVTYVVLAEVKDDKKRFLEIYSKLMKVLMFLSCFILFSFAACARPLILFLIGEKWESSIEMFQWIAIGGVFVIIQSYLSNVLNVYGKSAWQLKALIYSRFLNLIIIIITAPMGIMPIIYGQVIAEILNVIILQWFCAPLLGFSVLKQYRDSASFLFSGIFLAAVMIYFGKKLEGILHHNFLEAGLIFLTFSILYISFHYMVNKKILFEILSLRHNLIKKE